MSLLEVSAGADAPAVVNVVIEIPAHTAPVKYEVDKETGALFVDRFLATAMYYPANYGYVPATLAEDGDPVDVLVVTPSPLVHASVIPTLVIGMLEMTDEKGVDVKLIGVPDPRLCSSYAGIDDYKQLPKDLLQAVEHFFSHYKDLEANKWVKIGSWQGREAAKQEISKAIERYRSSARDN